MKYQDNNNLKRFFRETFPRMPGDDLSIQLFDFDNIFVVAVNLNIWTSKSFQLY